MCAFQYWKSSSLLETVNIHFSYLGTWFYSAQALPLLPPLYPHLFLLASSPTWLPSTCDRYLYQSPVNPCHGTASLLLQSWRLEAILCEDFSDLGYKPPAQQPATLPVDDFTAIPPFLVPDIAPHYPSISSHGPLAPKYTFTYHCSFAATWNWPKYSVNH